MTHRHLNRTALATLAALLIATVTTGCATQRAMDLGYATGHDKLRDREITAILDAGETAARNEESLLRVDDQGNKQPTRMHIIVVDRRGDVIGRRSMNDAWGGSVSIAQAKAYTAVAFSSNQNALTSRSIGALSQPGGPLWQIGNSNQEHNRSGLIEFPGGVPLYKNGKLIGAVGVSGDGVEQDENVAEAAAQRYAAPNAIRIDTVTDGGVPYTE